MRMFCQPVFSSDFPVFCVLVSCTHVNVQTADTEGSFVVQRLAEIAQAAKQHIDGIAEASNDPGMCIPQLELCVVMRVDLGTYVCVCVCVHVGVVCVGCVCVHTCVCDCMCDLHFCVLPFYACLHTQYHIGVYV